MSKVLDAVKDVLGTVAPTIATVYGGPLAGAAVHKLAKGLLGKEHATGEEVADYLALNQSPDTLLKLRELDKEFKAEMAKLDVDLEKLSVQREEIAVDDRKSARERQVETKDNAPAILGGGVILGFAFMIIALFWAEIPESNRPILYILVGVLGTSVTQVLNYYFGSSKGSKTKDSSIEKLAEFQMSQPDVLRSIAHMSTPYLPPEAAPLPKGPGLG